MVKVSILQMILQPQEPNNIFINEEPIIIAGVTYQRKKSFKSTSIDIRKYQSVKQTASVKIKSAEREEDLLIQELLKR